jgi:tRNA modification GTPase
MYTLDDTIAAIATPLGQGGIGIVRLSGPEALAVARRLFVPSGRVALDGAVSHRLIHGRVRNPDDGHTLDEALLAYMRAPGSYTGQDVVEIQGHGGPTPLRAILSACLRQGARMAHEGEFTLRAFLNGRLDLAQAEAVLDIITSRTEAALRVALNQLGGRLSGEIRALRQGLLGALAYLEAAIDFGEDVPAQDIAPDLQAHGERLAWLLGEAERGMVYRQGVRTVIVGRPNVGKSSLLNRLLRAERAIVTPVPGTTRDTLEETLQIQGVPLVLTDTAGIAESDDLVERLGIERSRQSAAQADLALVVFDASAPPGPEDAQVAALAAGRPAVVALNKSDLPAADDYGALLPEVPHIPVSALTGEGLPELERCLVETIFAGQVAAADEPLASNPRHRDLLQQALAHVQDACRALAAGLPDDLVAIDVAAAVDALGAITGERASEELLATIFGRFCIGK